MRPVSFRMLIEGCWCCGGLRCRVEFRIFFFLCGRMRGWAKIIVDCLIARVQGRNVFTECCICLRESVVR